MELLLIVALLVAGLALYLLPSGFAVLRNHRQTAPILIVNFFLGWTLIGWIIALAWSFSASPSHAANSPR